jgi:hypothetical protein
MRIKYYSLIKRHILKLLWPKKQTNTKNKTQKWRNSCFGSKLSMQNREAESKFFSPELDSTYQNSFKIFFSFCSHTNVDQCCL